MKNALTIDSSVFLSAFLGKEPQSEISIDFLSFVRNNNFRILMPILVVFEVLQGYYRSTKNLKETESIFEQFIDLNISHKLKILNLEASFLADFVAGHHFFDIKTSDTIVAISAMTSNTPLISWDKNLPKHSSSKLKTFTPQEFLQLAHQSS